MRKARTCSRCPKRDANGTCVVQGRYMAPEHPSCAYGRKMMHNEASARWMRKRQGYKKRTPKAHAESEVE